MSIYLPADRWFQGDPDDAFIGRPFWVSIRVLNRGEDFVEKLTWYGPAGRWGSAYDTDTLHFQITGFMRLDLPEPYHF